MGWTVGLFQLDRVRRFTRRGGCNLSIHPPPRREVGLLNLQVARSTVDVGQEIRRNGQWEPLTGPNNNL